MEEYVIFSREGPFICAVCPHNGGTRSAPLRSTAPHLLLLLCCCCLVLCWTLWLPLQDALGTAGRSSACPPGCSVSLTEVSADWWSLRGCLRLTCVSSGLLFRLLKQLLAKTISLESFLMFSTVCDYRSWRGSQKHGFQRGCLAPLQKPLGGTMGALANFNFR